MYEALSLKLLLYEALSLKLLVFEVLSFLTRTAIEVLSWLALLVQKYNY